MRHVLTHTSALGSGVILGTCLRTRHAFGYPLSANQLIATGLLEIDGWIYLGGTNRQVPALNSLDTKVPPMIGAIGGNVWIIAKARLEHSVALSSSNYLAFVTEPRTKDVHSA